MYTPDLLTMTDGTPVTSSAQWEARRGELQYIVLRITRIVAQTPSEVGLLEDVTSAILEQQRIERERDYDILTGLYSRQAFFRVCGELFEKPDTLRHAALMMTDLDNLKTIKEYNPQADTVLIDGHNHLFQPCITGLANEYASITGDISDMTLEAIVTWLDKTTASLTQKP